MSHLRTIAGAEPLCRLLSQHDRVGDVALQEVLSVGIAEEVGDVVDILTIHIVDGIATTATDADHLDDRRDLILFFAADIE